MNPACMQSDRRAGTESGCPTMNRPFSDPLGKGDNLALSHAIQIVGVLGIGVPVFSSERGFDRNRRFIGGLPAEGFAPRIERHENRFALGWQCIRAAPADVERLELSLAISVDEHYFEGIRYESPRNARSKVIATPVSFTWVISRSAEPGLRIQSSKNGLRFSSGASS